MSRLSWIACLALSLASAQSACAAWPFFAEDGLQPGTEEYYEAHAGDPVGSRQFYKYGKLWPPFPRPVGRPQLFIHKYHAAHYWPYPYLCQDREVVNSIIDMQVYNGWEQGTTLFDYHFDPLTNELNSSGQKQLNWIMTKAPDAYRQVYVANSGQPELTAARTLNVEREVTRLAGGQGAIPVLTRIADPNGRPASEVQKIFTNAADNMPLPVITYTPPSSGDSGSGG